MREKQKKKKKKHKEAALAAAALRLSKTGEAPTVGDRAAEEPPTLFSSRWTRA